MIPPCVRRHRSLSVRPDPVSTRRASGLGFVARPSNPMVLWWTTANPVCRLRSWVATLHQLRSTTSSCFSCHHAARTWPRPDTGAIELSLLVSPLLRGPARLRPFVDIKSAPHAKHTTSRIDGLPHMARASESGSVPVNFLWNWERMEKVR
jgi:hypothetical protein